MTQPSDATKVAERITDDLSKALSCWAEVSATVRSESLLPSVAPGITSHQLLGKADLAVYAAKERGKNRYAEFPRRHVRCTLRASS